MELLGLIGLVILIHYYGPKSEPFWNSFDYAPIPFIHLPVLRYFDNEPTGYDAGTRGYYNPNFALEVAQGLDTGN